METIIELKDVSKVYILGGLEIAALQHVNLSIKKGDFVALMGPSGSGKSTGMNLIGSLDIPSQGEVYLGKNNIASLGESALAALRGRKIGFIFQGFNLINNLTALENVMLPMVFQKIPRFIRGKKASVLLKNVGLEKRMYHYPTQLSGGEMQRVAIARALANDPEVILADEPTGNLDSKRGTEILQLLADLHRSGKTIIIVTHDGNLAKKYANIIYYLKDGRIVSIWRRRFKKGALK